MVSSEWIIHAMQLGQIHFIGLAYVTPLSVVHVLQTFVILLLTFQSSTAQTEKIYRGIARDCPQASKSGFSIALILSWAIKYLG
ncbi:hypothetical protein ACJX0J_032428, partial [Zea mays]